MYYVEIKRDFENGDIVTDALCRWRVRIYRRGQIISVGGTYTITKKGGERWAKRWYKRHTKPTKSYTLPLDS